MVGFTSSWSRSTWNFAAHLCSRGCVHACVCTIKIPPLITLVTQDRFASFWGSFFSEFYGASLRSCVYVCLCTIKVHVLLNFDTHRLILKILQSFFSEFCSTSSGYTHGYIECNNFRMSVVYMNMYYTVHYNDKQNSI